MFSNSKFDFWFLSWKIEKKLELLSLVKDFLVLKKPVAKMSGIRNGGFRNDNDNPEVEKIARYFFVDIC